MRELMDYFSKLIGGQSSNPSHRIAGIIELLLQIVTAAGIIGLLVAWSQVASLLAPEESSTLFRARLMRGIFSLAVPLVILLFLSAMRIKFATLIEEKISDASAMTSARYMWVLVIIFSLIILAISVSLIMEGLAEFNYAA